MTAPAALRDVVAGFLRGYTGPAEVAADDLIRIVRQWDSAPADDESWEPMETSTTWGVGWSWPWALLMVAAAAMVTATVTATMWLVSP